MNNVKSLRKNKGMSQQELAEYLHVHQTSVSQWETGRTNPDTVQAIELAAYFNVSVDYVLGVQTPQYINLNIEDYLGLPDSDTKADKKNKPASPEEERPVSERRMLLIEKIKRLSEEDFLLTEDYVETRELAKKAKQLQMNQDQ